MKIWGIIRLAYELSSILIRATVEIESIIERKCQNEPTVTTSAHEVID